ncbi:MAG TPA: hypothetical protein DDX91_03995 [Ruminococcaceae bacterium]|nr:hypothetical protein [Oscillospiraceae bacterium]
MKLKKALSLFIAGIMTVSSLNISAFAEGKERNAAISSVSEEAAEPTGAEDTINGNNQYRNEKEQSGEYEAESNYKPVITGASTNQLIYGTEEAAITRAQWLHDLAVVFEMTVEDDNYPDNYFADLTFESEYYHDILLTVDFGVVNIEAGQKLFPNEPLTRSFAAATLNYCLGFKLEEGAGYTFTESTNALFAELRDDFQTALNRGWFKTVNGDFKPEQTVTQEESRLMLDDAAAVLSAELYVGPEENDFVFADYVVQMPANVLAEVKEDQVTLRNYGSKALSAGDTFVFFKNGYPYIYKAENVKKSANTLIVTVSSAPEDAVISGSTKGDVPVDIDMFEPAEGVTVTKPALPDASVMGSNTQINQTINAKKTLNLGNGLSVTVECDLSNLVLHKDIGFFQDTNYVSVTGDISLKGTAEIDFVELANGKSTISLGKINYGPLFIDVSVTVSLKGGVIVNYKGNFEAGVAFSNRSGFRVLKSFSKRSSSIAVYIKGSLGLKLSVGIELGSLLRADLYAEVGFKFDMRQTNYGQGKPSYCRNIEAYLYASIGASAKFDLLIIKKTFSKSYDIFSKNNTPCYIMFHVEDGARKDSCTRGSSVYTTSSGSKFGVYCQKGGGSRYWYPGNNGGGYTSFNGSYAVPEVLWEYKIKTDAKNKEYACLAKYNGNAGVVMIPETIDGYEVRELGSGLFENKSSLFSVTIPDSVIVIGSHAFAGCENLSTVNLSKNIETLDAGAFYNCKRLTSVFIPKSLANVSSGGSGIDPHRVFEGSGLKHVEFEKGITKIQNYLFTDCAFLESIEIPETVTEIGSCSFMNTKLTSVKIPDSVIVIGSHAFSDCEYLSTVNLSKNIEALDAGAFYNCKKLISIFIPKSLVNVSNGGSGLDPHRVFAKSGLKNVEFEKGTDKIQPYLFGECYELESIVVPNTVTEIGHSAFLNCTSLITITLPNKLKELETTLFGGCTSLAKITIPDSVTNMGNKVFSSCTSLKEITVPDSVTDMGEGVFSDCSSLETAKLSNTLVNIGASTFANCTSLKNTEIPKTVENIRANAFKNCVSLTKLTLPENIVLIEDSAFENCDGLTEMILPDKVTSLGNRAFYDCDSLKKAVMPDSLQRIGQNAFYGCDVLSDVDMGNGVAEIGGSAFRLCPELTSISVSANVSSIGEYVFAENTKLKDITVYPGVTSISGNAFSYYNINIHGVRGSYAETFANERDKTAFIPIDSIPADMLTVKFLDSRGRYTVNPSFTWTGSKMKPELKVFLGSYELINGTDYTVLNYKNNAEVGAASAEVQGMGIYSGKTTGIFTIEAISILGLGVDYQETFDYTGEPITPPIRVFYSGEELTEGVDYTVSYENNIEPGEGAIVITGIGHFKDTGTVKFTILPVNICTTAEELQSAHPYANNENTSYLYKHEGAKTISLTFSEDTLFEEPYDYLVIIDSQGRETRYTGTELSGKTVTVEGDSVKLKLVSDGTGVEYGFRVTKIEIDKSEEQKFVDKGTGIEVSDESGAFDEDAELKVNVVEKDSNKNQTVYNIYFENGSGEKVQPNGEVTVKIPIPQGWDYEKVTVSRREPDGSLTDMKAICKNGYAVFVTDHFSEYVLAKKPDVQKGEINGDGKLSAVDAKWVLQAVSGSRKLTPEQEAAADVNGDGKINAVDAKWILQAVSGSRVLD